MHWRPVIHNVEYNNCHRLNLCTNNTRNNFFTIETKSTSQQFYCSLMIFLRKTSPYTTMPMLNLLKPTGYVMHNQFNIQQLRSAHTVFMFFVFIWEQTATSAPYNVNWLVSMAEMKSVYSAVRAGTLNKAVCASSLKGKTWMVFGNPESVYVINIVSKLLAGQPMNRGSKTGRYQDNILFFRWDTPLCFQ